MLINSVLSQASRATFSLLNGVDHWLGLPKRWEESIEFRRSWRQHVQTASSAGGRLWIHGASVGELEDLAAFFLNNNYLATAGYGPDRIILTASSRSAANHLQRWQAQGHFFYAGPLPPENRREIADFLEHTQPELLLLSHADLWPLLLQMAQPHLRRGTVWLPDQAGRGRCLGLQLLSSSLRKIAVRRDDDLAAFPAARVRPAVGLMLGNPRVDRIMERLKRAEERQGELSDHWPRQKTNKKTLVLGSAWIEDAQIFAQALNRVPGFLQNWRLVVVPHHIKDTFQISAIQSLLPHADLLRMEGLLVEAYGRADAAYVGGAFGRGLHNLLEAALWKLPLICGPNLRAQTEAPELASRGHLQVVSNADDLARSLGQLLQPETEQSWRAVASTSAAWLESGSGASQRLAEILARL